VSGVGLACFVGGVFALRMAGGFALAALIGDSEVWTRLLNLIPLALVTSVVAVQVFTTRGEFVLDARMPGIAVAAVLAWRRLPLAVVVLGAAVVTATLRALF
jgi:branched-subunit amino acid transport protein